MIRKPKFAPLSRDEKNAIAKEIVNKAKALIADSGKPEHVGCHRVAVARLGALVVMMTTPFSGVKTGHGDFRYQVDIWQVGVGKVFGACWQPQERWASELECFRLVKGDLIDGLFRRHGAPVEA